VPPLLDRMRFTDRNERISWFFRHLGGTPLLAPEGVSTTMSHSWYSLLTLKFRPTKKSKLLEGKIFFIHAFIHKVLVQNVHGNIKL